jgi:hypothetical protein
MDGARGVIVTGAFDRIILRLSPPSPNLARTTATDGHRTRPRLVMVLTLPRCTLGLHRLISDLPHRRCLLL